jgi:hypothetical protein
LGSDFVDVTGARAKTGLGTAVVVVVGSVVAVPESAVVVVVPSVESL